MSDAYSNAWPWQSDPFEWRSLCGSLRSTMMGLLRRWMRIRGRRIKNENWSLRVQVLSPSSTTMVRDSFNFRIFLSKNFLPRLAFLPRPKISHAITFSSTLLTRPWPKHPLQFYSGRTIASTGGALGTPHLLGMLPNTGYLTSKPQTHLRALCMSENREDPL